MRVFLFAIPLLFLFAACGSGGTASGPGLYIALGDSLSEGVGASDRESTAFVPLVREGLGAGLELTNLGHSGDTSGDLLLHGHLDQAVRRIDARNGDDNPDNDVKLLTLEIGGNDLLELFFSLVLPGACPGVQETLARERCLDALGEMMDRFGENLAEALDVLLASDPGLPIVVMTLYNPFSSGLQAIDELAEMVLEGRPDTPIPEGLNDIVRAEAEERGITLVDWHPLFEGRANEFIAIDLKHPNDAGYRVMADAVLDAVR